jgi:hypothetical protein
MHPLGDHEDHRTAERIERKPEGNKKKRVQVDPGDLRRDRSFSEKDRAAAEKTAQDRPDRDQALAFAKGASPSMMMTAAMRSGSRRTIQGNIDA